MHEYLTSNVRAKTVIEDWPLWYRYTHGVAGERLFREMKDHGRLLCGVCPQCGHAFLPPSLYCEDCFAEITTYRPVEGNGRVATFCVLHESLDEQPLDEPVVVALVEFEGVRGGWLAPLRDVPPDQVEIGMAVRPVWKPDGQREGAVSDLMHFVPVETA